MNLASLFKDPPPAYAFEVSEAGIASGAVTGAASCGLSPVEGVVVSA
jgi:hypothetical protein